MAGKARAEVEGGLYHVITRGNNRRQIVGSSWSEVVSSVRACAGVGVAFGADLRPDCAETGAGRASSNRAAPVSIMTLMVFSESRRTVP